MLTSSVYINTVDSYKHATTDDTGKPLNISLSKTTPSLAISKWDGEANLTLTYSPAVPVVASAQVSADTVQYSAGTETVKSFPTDNGTELEVVLNSLPTHNDFAFQVSGAENLNFYYQPAFDEQYKVGDKEFGQTIASITPNDIFDAKGKTIAHRPDDVIGSYAVYGNKKNNKYTTGKLTHIFRPKATDANNNSVWATLSYVQGVLTVTVPQDFLDKAAYPVIVDPTLGYNTAGGSAASLSSYLLGNHYQMPENGTATNFHISANTLNEDWQWTAGIYNSNGTSASGQSQVGITANQHLTQNGQAWISAPITGTLVSGNYYYLPVEEFDNAGGHFVWYYDATGVPRSYEAHTYSAGSMPNPMDTLNDDTGSTMSAYIDYTTGGGGGSAAASTTQFLMLMGLGT